MKFIWFMVYGIRKNFILPYIINIISGMNHHQNEFETEIEQGPAANDASSRILGHIILFEYGNSHLWWWTLRQLRRPRIHAG